MSNKKLLLAILIAALILIPFLQFSSALSEDFAFYSQRQDISACSCGITADTYTVRNTGAITSTFQLVKSGTAAPFSTFSEDYFSLEPGQSKEVINYINLPCSAKGDYNIITNVSTVFGASKEFEQKISAGNCVNFKITPKESFKEKCPCSPATYEVEIENTGSFEETYMMNVTTYAQYASLSESVLKLVPGEKKSVFAFFNLPCGVFGTQELKVNVITEKSSQIAEVPLTLDIGNCYDYLLESDSEFRLCEGNNLTAPVTIFNKAGIGNTFTITTSENFAKLVNSTFFLWGNESGNALLTVDASKLRQGDYAFEIKSVSERGNDEQAIDAKAIVEKCHDFVFTIAMPDEKIIAGKTYTYKVDIKNTGTRQAAFNVTSEGQEWVSIIEKNFTLNSGDSKTANVIADIPANASGKSDFKIIITSDGIYDEKDIQMYVIDSSTAYELDISAKNTKVGAGEDEILLELKNKGISGATYELLLDAPPWAELSEKSVFLGAGETKTVTLKTDVPESVAEGKYALNILASVPESEIGYSRDFEINVIFAPWYKKAYNFIAPYAAAYWMYALMALGAVIVIALLVWAIKKLARRAKEKRKEKQIVVEQKIREEEPVLREFARASIADSEPYRLSLKEPVKKRKFNWAKFLKVFFILLIIAGVASMVWFNWPGIQNYTSGIFAQKNETSPEVGINRSSGIEGYGNVVYIRETGDLDIPVVIKNRAPAKVIYAIRIANSSFISSDVNSLELDVNETKTIHLIVHATPELSDGIYEIDLGLSINENDLKYSEKIELRIERQKSTFERYLPYIIIGIALAFVLILILALTRKSKFDKKKEKLDITIARTKERNLKKPIGIAVIILAILILGYGAYTYISNLPEPVDEQGSIDLASFDNQTMNLKLKPNQKIIIPLVFENRFSDTATYNIKSDADWIEATDDRIRLSQGEAVEINITAEPAKDADEGEYAVTIEGNVEGKTYSKKINFYLRKSVGMNLLQNKYFVTGIIAIIAGLVILAYSRKRKSDKKKFIQEIRQEITESKQKPAVSGKTKIKLGPKRKSS